MQLELFKPLNLKFILYGAFLLLVLIFLSIEVKQNLNLISKAFQAMSAIYVLASFLITIISVLVGVISWHLILNHGLAKFPKDLTYRIYLIGQLAKYVPGGLWVYIFQMRLALPFGISKQRIFITSIAYLIISMSSGAMIGIFAIPTAIQLNEAFGWLYLITPAILFLLYPTIFNWIMNSLFRFMKKQRNLNNLKFSEIVPSYFVGLLNWLLLGTQLTFLTLSFSTLKFFDFIEITALMSLAMIIGQVLFFFPSGIGARELVIIFGLQKWVTYEEALTIALVSRSCFIFADVLLGTLSLRKVISQNLL